MMPLRNQSSVTKAFQAVSVTDKLALEVFNLFCGRDTHAHATGDEYDLLGVPVMM